MRRSRYPSQVLFFLVVIIVFLHQHGLCRAENPCAEFPLKRHPSYSEPHQLQALESIGRPEIVISESESGALVVDASAVYVVDMAIFAQTSLNFDRYAEFKAPHIATSTVVIPEDENRKMVIWQKMDYGLISSSQYLTVKTYRDATAFGFEGSCWRLYHPGRPVKNYPDSSIFNQFDGSWYIEPLGVVTVNERPLTRVYVRYFLKVSYRWWMPAFIINYFSRETGMLEKDVTRFLSIFKCLSDNYGDTNKCRPH